MPPTVITVAAGAEVSGPTPDSEWVAVLDRYHHTAAEILHDHARDGRRCSVCRQTWPCRAACAAAFALEL